MAKSKKSSLSRRVKRSLRKTRRGGACALRTPNSPMLSISNACGPGTQVLFSNLEVGLKVKVVDDIEDIVVPSALNSVSATLGNNVAKGGIREMLKKTSDYLFEVVDVNEDGRKRTVELKVVSFPNTNSKGRRTGNSHMCSPSNDDFEKELCNGFKLIGPMSDILYNKYSFLRVN